MYAQSKNKAMNCTIMTAIKSEEFRENSAITPSLTKNTHKRK
ncbi:hypothetical protein CSC35_4238 [Enterobacter hormaechei]|nr:hypothetical protein CSC35_4238 [Enterobacter hormaechei]